MSDCKCKDDCIPDCDCDPCSDRPALTAVLDVLKTLGAPFTCDDGFHFTIEPASQITTATGTFTFSVTATGITWTEGSGSKSIDWCQDDTTGRWHPCCISTDGGSTWKRACMDCDDCP